MNMPKRSLTEAEIAQARELYAQMRGPDFSDCLTPEAWARSYEASRREMEERRLDDLIRELEAARRPSPPRDLSVPQEYLDWLYGTD